MPSTELTQVAEPLLRSHGFGESRALTCQQSLALFIQLLAFGHVYRCTDVFNEIADALKPDDLSSERT